MRGGGDGRLLLSSLAVVESVTPEQRDARRAEAIEALVAAQWEPTWPPVIHLLRQVEAVLAVADKWATAN